MDDERNDRPDDETGDHFDGHAGDPPDNISGDYFDEPLLDTAPEHVAVRQPPKRHGGIRGLLLLAHAAHGIYFLIGIIGAMGTSAVLHEVETHYAPPPPPSPPPQEMHQSPMALQQKMAAPQVKELAFLIDSYYLKHGRLPSSLQELKMASPGAALTGPMKSPFSAGVGYRVTGPGRYELVLPGVGLMENAGVPLSVPTGAPPGGVAMGPNDPMLRAWWERTYTSRMITATALAQPAVGPSYPSAPIGPRLPITPMPPAPLPPRYTQPSAPLPPGPGRPSMSGRPGGPSGPGVLVPGGIRR